VSVRPIGEGGRQASGGYDFCGYIPGEEYLDRGRSRRRMSRMTAIALTLAGVAATGIAALAFMW
jgi:hypothetical protein